MTLPRRSLALALLLVFGSTGSGLPMCLTSLAQIATPCEMHGGGASGVAAQAAARHLPVNGHQPHFSGRAESRLQPRPNAGSPDLESCHAGTADAGCLASGACPSAGTSAPTAAVLDPEVVSPTRGPVTLHASRFTSFLAPPLAPPPQA